MKTSFRTISMVTVAMLVACNGGEEVDIGGRLSPALEPAVMSGGMGGAATSAAASGQGGSGAATTGVTSGQGGSGAATTGGAGGQGGSGAATIGGAGGQGGSGAATTGGAGGQGGTADPVVEDLIASFTPGDPYAWFQAHEEDAAALTNDQLEVLIAGLSGYEIEPACTETEKDTEPLANSACSTSCWLLGNNSWGHAFCVIALASATAYCDGFVCQSL